MRRLVGRRGAGAASGSGSAREEGARVADMIRQVAKSAARRITTASGITPDTVSLVRLG